MRTKRQFIWTASTLLKWAWPTASVAPPPVFNPAIVVGQTLWIITDDGRVKKGRVPAPYLIPDTSKANMPRP